MSDDLVKRLRELEQWIRKPDVPALTLSCDLFDEAADRIEQLEAANLKAALIKVDDELRIEQLEAALREIAGARPECCSISDAMQGIARKALDAK